MCENAEYFRPRLEQAILIAPVLSIANLESELLKTLANDVTAISTLEAIGPEVM